VSRPSRELGLRRAPHLGWPAMSSIQQLIASIEGRLRELNDEISSLQDAQSALILNRSSPADQSHAKPAANEPSPALQERLDCVGSQRGGVHARREPRADDCARSRTRPAPTTLTCSHCFGSSERMDAFAGPNRDKPPAGTLPPMRTESASERRSLQPEAKAKVARSAGRCTRPAQITRTHLSGVRGQSALLWVECSGPASALTSTDAARRGAVRDPEDPVCSRRGCARTGMHLYI
jgi:hypothetical protein